MSLPRNPHLVRHDQCLPDSANLDPSSAATRPINRRASSQGKGSDTDAGAMSDGTRRPQSQLEGQATWSFPRLPPDHHHHLHQQRPNQSLRPRKPVHSSPLAASLLRNSWPERALRKGEHFARLMPLIKSVARFEGGKIFPKAVGNAGLEVKKEPSTMTGVKKEGGD